MKIFDGKTFKYRASHDTQGLWRTASTFKFSERDCARPVMILYHSNSGRLEKLAILAMHFKLFRLDSIWFLENFRRVNSDRASPILLLRAWTKNWLRSEQNLVCKWKNEKIYNISYQNEIWNKGSKKFKYISRSSNIVLARRGILLDFDNRVNTKGSVWN